MEDGRNLEAEGSVDSAASEEHLQLRSTEVPKVPSPSPVQAGHCEAQGKSHGEPGRGKYLVQRRGVPAAPAHSFQSDPLELPVVLLGLLGGV